MKKKDKVSKKDFTNDQLPSTRYEVFIDCLKIKKAVLAQIGLRFLLFCLPLIISCMLMDVSVSGLQEQYLEGKVEITAVYSTINMFNLINVVFWGLVGVGCAGCFRAIRRLIWQEPIFVNSDFFDGVRLNHKAFFLIFATVGVVVFASTSVYTAEGGLSAIQYLSVFTAIIFLIPVLVIMMGLYNVYNITIKEALYNSFTIYVKNLFTNLLMTLAIVALFALIMILGALKYLLLFVVPLFIAPVLILAIHLYLCYLFDIHINKKSYPEYVDRGIYRRK